MNRWTLEEDRTLLDHVARHGTRHWKLLEESGKLPHRDNRSCYRRYCILSSSQSRMAEAQFGPCHDGTVAAPPPAAAPSAAAPSAAAPSAAAPSAAPSAAAAAAPASTHLTSPKNAGSLTSSWTGAGGQKGFKGSKVAINRHVEAAILGPSWRGGLFGPDLPSKSGHQVIKSGHQVSKPGQQALLAPGAPKDQGQGSTPRGQGAGGASQGACASGLRLASSTEAPSARDHQLVLEGALLRRMRTKQLALLGGQGGAGAGAAGPAGAGPGAGAGAGAAAAASAGVGGPARPGAGADAGASAAGGAAAARAAGAADPAGPAGHAAASASATTAPAAAAASGPGFAASRGQAPQTLLPRVAARQVQPGAGALLPALTGDALALLQALGMADAQRPLVGGGWSATNRQANMVIGAGSVPGKGLPSSFKGEPASAAAELRVRTGVASLPGLPGGRGDELGVQTGMAPAFVGQAGVASDLRVQLMGAAEIGVQSRTAARPGAQQRTGQGIQQAARPGVWQAGCMLPGAGFLLPEAAGAREQRLIQSRTVSGSRPHAGPQPEAGMGAQDRAGSKLGHKLGMGAQARAGQGEGVWTREEVAGQGAAIGEAILREKARLGLDGSVGPTLHPLDHPTGGEGAGWILQQRGMGVHRGQPPITPSAPWELPNQQSDTSGEVKECRDDPLPQSSAAQSAGFGDTLPVARNQIGRPWQGSTRSSWLGPRGQSSSLPASSSASGSLWKSLQTTDSLPGSGVYSRLGAQQGTLSGPQFARSLQRIDSMQRVHSQEQSSVRTRNKAEADPTHLVLPASSLDLQGLDPDPWSPRVSLGALPRGTMQGAGQLAGCRTAGSASGSGSALGPGGLIGGEARAESEAQGLGFAGLPLVGQSCVDVQQHLRAALQQEQQQQHPQQKHLHAALLLEADHDANFDSGPLLGMGSHSMWENHLTQLRSSHPVTQGLEPQDGAVTSHTTGLNVASTNKLFQASQSGAAPGATVGPTVSQPQSVGQSAPCPGQKRRLKRKERPAGSLAEADCAPLSNNMPPFNGALVSSCPLPQSPYVGTDIVESEGFRGGQQELTTPDPTDRGGTCQSEEALGVGNGMPRALHLQDLQQRKWQTADIQERAQGLSSKGGFISDDAVHAMALGGDRSPSKGIQSRIDLEGAQDGQGRKAMPNQVDPMVSFNATAVDGYQDRSQPRITSYGKLIQAQNALEQQSVQEVCELGDLEMLIFGCIQEERLESR